ncbi:MAG: hypothetical protein HOV77_05595 [Hamadaea sp.]|uniref:hypothetical protein n=1 Tax=Hamadaea sp. TaxID=2024425 RepID=UPI00181C9F3F|nr:hypothetical protein [Hamadaea sp.]NUT18638.1 hypothetical protein [Hamadaea sp.]
MSVEPSSPPEQAKGSSFWTSLPGLLTAVAGLLTALVGVGTFIYQIAGSGKDDSPAVAGNSASANQVTQSQGSTGTSPSPSAPSGGGVAYLSKTTLLFTNNGVDFDHEPEPIVHPDDGSDAYDAGGKIATSSASRIADWTETADPTQEQCAGLVNREGHDTGGKAPTYYKGARFCMRTDPGKIVFIKFVSGTKMEVTVWPPHA